MSAYTQLVMGRVADKLAQGPESKHADEFPHMSLPVAHAVAQEKGIPTTGTALAHALWGAASPVEGQGRATTGLIQGTGAGLGSALGSMLAGKITGGQPPTSSTRALTSLVLQQLGGLGGAVLARNYAPDIEQMVTNNRRRAARAREREQEQLMAYLESSDLAHAYGR